MRINVLSLFSPLIADFLKYGIISRAIAESKLDVKLFDIRQHGIGRHKKVDDRPFGGGAGMLLRAEPVVETLESIPKDVRGRVILLAPAGDSFSQEVAKSLSKLDALTLICGRYEGFDHRIESYVDSSLSIGPYITMGGEVPAMVVMETVARLLPGVLGNEESTLDESCDDYIEHPQYTKPVEFRGQKVPAILRSGDHKKILDWRKQRKIKKQNGRNKGKERGFS